MAEKKNLIRELIETGKRNGKLTTKEINDAIEESGFDMEQIDKLYETMESHGVEIVDEPDGEAFTLTEESVDEFESSLSAEGVAIDDPVKVYLKEIGRVPLLSSDEEIQLALDILAGSQAEEQKKDAFPDIWKIEKNIRLTEPQRKAQLEEARKGLAPEQTEQLEALDAVLRKGEKAKQRLSEANLRLVVSIAKRYVGRGMQFLDLIQEGNLGLIKAVEKFDHTKGFKFSTYATWWIRQAITRAIA
ncbi:sigma-70 family RNA polymerase sigma factor, partial [Candidatus Allofournierella excrementigallinarum]|uniref:sigma-70 family RNA polymerase sigma factor n=1 Tax=Candidatus Allofournierella excrementigallinarum TaxID=2838592 RepID=UPI00374F6AA0